MLKIIKFTVLSISFLFLLSLTFCKGEANQNEDAKKNIKPKTQKVMSEAAKKGKILFTSKACASCHTKFGQGDLPLGTDLKDVMKRRNEAWVRKWLLDSKNQKDPKSMFNTDAFIKKISKKFKVHMYKIPLNKDELDAIIAYLKYHSS